MRAQEVKYRYYYFIMRSTGLQLEIEDYYCRSLVAL